MYKQINEEVLLEPVFMNHPPLFLDDFILIDK